MLASISRYGGWFVLTGRGGRKGEASLKCVIRSRAACHSTANDRITHVTTNVRRPRKRTALNA